MREVYKRNGDESGPNYILDLDGSNGNVYYLWSVLKNLLGEDAVEESKNNPPYEGYEGVLDYCIHNLGPDPHGIEFRMYGHEVGQVSDYRDALRHNTE